MNINDSIIRKNKPRLEEQQVWIEITKRMSEDPTSSVQRICSYIQNLLIWQKEMVMAEMFNLQEEDASRKGKVREIKQIRQRIKNYRQALKEIRQEKPRRTSDSCEWGLREKLYSLLWVLEEEGIL